jgi:PTS system mannose-specific IIA component
MVYVVLAGHGTFAAGLREASEMILGEQRGLGVLGLFPGDTLESFVEKLERTLDQAQEGQEVLFLTDLKSGTPFNAAMLICLRRGAACLAGANLPMLLEVLSNRNELSVEELSKTAAAAGRDGIADSNSAAVASQIK